MSRPKSLLKEEVPNNVIGEIAHYLETVCGIPGCSAVLHLEDAEKIVQIILEFNNKHKEGD